MYFNPISAPLYGRIWLYQNIPKFQNFPMVVPPASPPIQIPQKNFCSAAHEETTLRVGSICSRPRKMKFLNVRAHFSVAKCVAYFCGLFLKCLQHIKSKRKTKEYSSSYTYTSLPMQNICCILSLPILLYRVLFEVKPYYVAVHFQ